MSLDDLNWVLQDLRMFDFILSDHAQKRMLERMITEDDIAAVASTYSRVELQKSGTFKITGKDTAGDQLTIVCAYDGDTLIVTIF